MRYALRKMRNSEQAAERKRKRQAKLEEKAQQGAKEAQAQAPDSKEAQAAEDGEPGWHVGPVNSVGAAFTSAHLCDVQSAV